MLFKRGIQTFALEREHCVGYITHVRSCLSGIGNLTVFVLPLRCLFVLFRRWSEVYFRNVIQKSTITKAKSKKKASTERKSKETDQYRQRSMFQRQCEQSHAPILSYRCQFPFHQHCNRGRISKTAERDLPSGIQTIAVAQWPMSLTLTKSRDLIGTF